MELWSVEDVRRAWQRNRRMANNDEEGDADRDPNVPGTVLYQSPRAPRGTAEAEQHYHDTEILAHRVAPVLSVDAGWRATQECVRYVTLLAG
jgi:hypothetical protein